MILMQTGSRWGSGPYRMRHYRDGRQITRVAFEQLFDQHGCTPKSGSPMETTPYGFRKKWAA